ncbi:MAG: hypothetical protein ABI651_05840 [Verrucomicrobiota bacterium]
MNARTPFWPLLRNDLGIGHYPGIPWALGLGFYLTLWLVTSFVPLLLLFKASEGDLGIFFTAFGNLVGFAFVWWMAMTSWLFAFALFPGISNPIQSVRAFEFMFTRAIDRRRLFRTRAAVIYWVMLGPLLLNLLVSAGSPETTLGPDASDPATATLRREQYLKTFPDSHPKEGKFQVQPVPNVVPHGAVALSAWILWLGTLGLLFMQGYCVLLARHVQHNSWLTCLGGAPLLTVCLLSLFVPRVYPQLYEQSFLFFARNHVPLLIGLLVLIPVVQIFSERRFCELEII